MLLNAVELALVNNPIRQKLLRRTVGWMYDAARAPEVSRALEIGCGQGDALPEIARRFAPQSLDAFDLDAGQVARARRRAQDRVGPELALQLWVGDAEQISAPDEHYDAVFEFTIFHHIPDWRRALREVRRVLRPGGLFLFDELSLEFFRDIPVLSPVMRRATVHPWDTMFDFPRFRRGLAEAGLRLEALRADIVPGWHHGVAVRE